MEEVIFMLRSCIKEETRVQNVNRYTYVISFLTNNVVPQYQLVLRLFLYCFFIVFKSYLYTNREIDSTIRRGI